MRTVRSYAALAAVFALVIACGPKVPPGTPPPSPELKAVFTATEVVKQIGRLQATVIAADHDGSLPSRVAVPIVKYLLSANEIAHAGAIGWFAALQTGFTELKKQLAPADVAKYAIYFDAIETLLATHGGTDDEPASARLLREVPAPRVARSLEAPAF